MWRIIFIAGLVSALFLSRSACSVACPLFLVGEALWRSGERLWGRIYTLPFVVDVILRSAKYLLLTGVTLTLLLPGKSLETELASGELMATTTIVIFLLLSLFFQLPWCRYFCPYGALLGIISLASLAKIKRSTNLCVRCHKCSNRCPANLPVMLRTTVRSPECLACYRCVDGCPAPGALNMTALDQYRIPCWLMGLLMTLTLIGTLVNYTFG